MFEKIIAFFMSIIAFFAQLFGLANPVANYNEYKDLSYGSSANQVVDFCLPKDVSSVPLMVFIHGGAWYAGDEDSYIDSIRYCAADLKIAAVSVNYRFITEGGDIDYTHMLADITSALQLVKNKAAEQGVAITKCGIGGDSAGGHLSLLYSYKNADVSPIQIGFVFSNSGPVNLASDDFYATTESMDENFRCLLGSELCGVDFTAATRKNLLVQAALLACSPISYVNGSTVPTLFAHGEKDIVVPISGARELDSALTLYGVPHNYFVYPNSGHSLDNDSEIATEYNAKLVWYVNTYLK